MFVRSFIFDIAITYYNIIILRAKNVAGLVTVREIVLVVPVNDESVCAKKGQSDHTTGIQCDSI